MISATCCAARLFSGGDCQTASSCASAGKPRIPPIPGRAAAAPSAAPHFTTERRDAERLVKLILFLLMPMSPPASGRDSTGSLEDGDSETINEFLNGDRLSPFTHGQRATCRHTAFSRRSSWRALSGRLEPVHAQLRS